MRDRLRLPLRFDAEALRGDLAHVGSGAWLPHFVSDNYSGSWDVLPLRAPSGAHHPIEAIYPNPSATEFEDTASLAVCPHVREVLAAFACPLQSVRLMRLKPGSAIRPHRDHDLAPEFGRARLHIPITTSPGVDFRLSGERVVMNEGECWYLRLSDEHSVVNGGNADRVHLVIDAIVNPWLESLLEAADREAARAPADAPPLSDLDRFRALVAHDASLQKELLDVPDPREFVALVIRVASGRGYRLTPQEIEDAMRSKRGEWRERVA